MATYELIKDYYGVAQNQKLGFVPDQLNLNPYWIVVVLPFSSEVTFERGSMSSYETDPSQAVNVIRRPLIITSDAHSVQSGHSKSSFEGNLVVSLFPGGTDYMSSVFPGDWCAAWMLQSEEQAKGLLRRIQKFDASKPCNGFMDGLKFLGRVLSMRKQLTQSAEGLRTAGFNLQATSFKEFDAETFFDPNLSEGNNTTGNFFAKLAQDIKYFFSLGKNGNVGVTSQQAIPFLLTLLLGKGVPQTLAKPLSSKQFPGAPAPAVGLNGQDPGVPDEEAPYAYLVPAEVGALLGKDSGSKASGILSAADINEVVVGVQNFSGGTNNGSVSSAAAAAIFTPDGLTSINNNASHRKTGTELLSVFLPQVPDLTGEHSVWTILSQYMNSFMDEMYTCMRVNKNGVVVPTLTIRQQPFTTEVFVQSLQKASVSIASSNETADEMATLPYTRFLELPRWHIHPLMVINADVGRSDAKRYNFVHVYGQSALAQSGSTMTQQIVANPPIQDLADIKRSGLRPYMGTVACNPADIFKKYGASKWMALCADKVMGMHLTLDGTFNLQGIQAPIVPGDNIEFDGVVYHIESVLHTCQIEGSGRRAFYTTLQVSHGLRSDNPELIQPQNLGLTFSDQSLYGNVFERSAYDPGFTYDAQPSIPDEQVPVTPGHSLQTGSLTLTATILGQTIVPADIDAVE